LGRIFQESECMEVGEQRGWIRNSMYEAYLGSSKTFTRRFEQKLDPYRGLGEKLIFIIDGAIWIRNSGNRCLPPGHTDIRLVSRL
ncbi:MAG TPA: hypothetical protein VNE41_07255, partial [Chitinophagaceae bacterium]|nr:hypothetical protein [Chitinophagaceae bacterium]